MPKKSYERYLWMLNEEKDPTRAGVAREIAPNKPTPQHIQQSGIGKTDLHNLLRSVQLRADPHAQFEIRAYAEELMKIIMKWVPVTFEAFLEYRLNSVSLSATAVKVIFQLLRGEHAAEAIRALFAERAL